MYVHFIDEGWFEINELLEQYPHLTFNGLHFPTGLNSGRARFSYEGYSLFWPCRNKGQHYKDYPTQECIAEHRARCGANYLPEIVPGKAGCLDASRGRSGNSVFFMDLEQLQLLDEPWVIDGLRQTELETIADWALHGTSRTEFESEVARLNDVALTLTPFPTPGSARLPPPGRVYVQFLDQEWMEVNELLEEYPHLTYHGPHSIWTLFSFDGYSLIDSCWDKGEYYIDEDTGRHYPTQACIDEHRAKCGADYLPQIVPGEAGCLDMTRERSDDARNRGRSDYGVLFMNIAHRPLLDEPWVIDGLTQTELEIIARWMFGDITQAEFELEIAKLNDTSEDRAITDSGS